MRQFTNSNFRHAIVVLTVLLLTPFAAHAQRPASTKILPEETVAFVQIADIPDLVKRFSESSMGKITGEQGVKSLLEQLFAEAEKAFKPAEEQVGLSLSQILAIPQGEITFALVAPKSGPPAAVLMIDVGEQRANAKRLIDFLETQMQSDGMTKATKVVAGGTITSLHRGGDTAEGANYFQKDSMFVGTTNFQVAEQILAAWKGDKEQYVLSDNGAFTAVMQQSRGPRGDSPQIRWFIDPIELFRTAGRDNVGMKAAMAVLPVIGVDGLRCLGGSFTFASTDYDSFVQAHILMDEPRSGVLAALALKSGDTTPEDWVPHDVANYHTMNWDVEQTLREVAKLFDSFRGEGRFESDVVQAVSKQLDIDFRKDVLDAFGGRFSLATWFEKPARINNQAMLMGILLKKDSRFDKTLDKVIEQISPPQLEKKTFGGVSYYQFTPPENADAENPNEGSFLQPVGVKPCFGVVDDYLLLSLRPKTFERAILTRADASKSLANELDFKLVASRLRRQAGGAAPGVLVFERPEEGFRMLYEMATAADTRRRLSESADGNPVLSTLNKALKDNPLPPFAVFQEFLAPTGSMITADETGYHLTAFGLRRK